MRRRPWLAISGLAVAAAVSASPAAHPTAATSHEIENVAALARAYGAIRYFYPSDGAAGIDWDRLAVLAVGRVRSARDPAALLASLTAIFGPLGPGLLFATHLPPSRPASGAAGDLVAWRYLGPALDGCVDSGAYSAKRTHRAAVTSIDGFVTSRQSLPAEPWRGRSIRLRAQVRASAIGSGSFAALWLRVDRPNGALGFLDTMEDRPIRDDQWRHYTIEGSVAEDATAILFGALAKGAVSADFDAFELAVREPGGDWVALPIGDPGFETPADAPASPWLRRGSSKTAHISRPAEPAPEGSRFLRLEAASPESQADVFDDTTLAASAHADVELGQGLLARVPLALDAEARIDQRDAGRLRELMTATAAVRTASEKPDIDRRLADVVVAWNALRHFSPYWAETGVDWDQRLKPQLELAALASDNRPAQREVLRALMADARDGHGTVVDLLADDALAELKIQLGVVENRLVITASATPEQVPVGAVVLAIDGTPAAVRLDAERRAASGSDQWRSVRAAQALTLGRKGSAVQLRVDDGSGPRDVTLRYEAEGPVAERRPPPVTELEPALWYVDLTRATIASIAPMLDRLASARGVVFDVRGYPQDAGSMILSHLIDTPEADRWMHIAKLVGPFGRSIGWQSEGWNLAPKAPLVAGKRVFLTDARAISYAESVLGYVADRKLGTVIGSATAGANGNVVSFVVPSGFRVTFTGLRVTHHDGRGQHHLVGVKPDILLAPTIAGLPTGRDELLERALALLRAS